MRLHSCERAYLGDEGFESRLASARQDLILGLLQRQRPRVVMEVGCGADMVSDAGFVPEEEGDYFLKPFTHAQIRALEDQFSPAMLRGLGQLGGELPELASEIYVNARRRP